MYYIICGQNNINDCHLAAIISNLYDDVCRLCSIFILDHTSYDVHTKVSYLTVTHMFISHDEPHLRKVDLTSK